MNGSCSRGSRLRRAPSFSRRSSSRCGCLGSTPRSRTRADRPRRPAMRARRPSRSDHPRCNSACVRRQMNGRSWWLVGRRLGFGWVQKVKDVERGWGLRRLGLAWVGVWGWSIPLPSHSGFHSARPRLTMNSGFDTLDADLGRSVDPPATIPSIPFSWSPVLTFHLFIPFPSGRRLIDPVQQVEPTVRRSTIFHPFPSNSIPSIHPFNFH